MHEKRKDGIMEIELKARKDGIMENEMNVRKEKKNQME